MPPTNPTSILCLHYHTYTKYTSTGSFYHTNAHWQAGIHLPTHTHATHTNTHGYILKLNQIDNKLTRNQNQKTFWGKHTAANTFIEQEIKHTQRHTQAFLLIWRERNEISVICHVQITGIWNLSSRETLFQCSLGQQGLLHFI